MKKANKALEKIMKHVNSKVVMLGAFMFGVFICSASPVLAGSLFEELDSAFGKVYLALVALAPVVTGVAYVAGKLWQIIVPEKQGRAEPREWARNALVNYFLILAAGGIIGFIGEIAGNIK